MVREYFRRAEKVRTDKLDPKSLLDEVIREAEEEFDDCQSVATDLAKRKSQNQFSPLEITEQSIDNISRVEKLIDCVLGENRKHTVIIESKSSEKRFQAMECLIDRVIYYNNKILILSDSMPGLNSDILKVMSKKPSIAKIRETSEFFDKIHEFDCPYLDGVSHVFLLDMNSSASKSAIINRLQDTSNIFDRARSSANIIYNPQRTVIIGSDSASFLSKTDTTKHAIVNID